MLVRYLARKRAAPCAGIAGAGSPVAGMAGEGRLRAGWRGPGVSGSQEALRNEAHRLRKALEGPAVVARIPRTMRLLRRHIPELCMRMFPRGGAEKALCSAVTGIHPQSGCDIPE